MVVRIHPPDLSTPIDLDRSALLFDSLASMTTRLARVVSSNRWVREREGSRAVVGEGPTGQLLARTSVTRSQRPHQHCDVAQWKSARLISGAMMVRFHPSQPKGETAARVVEGRHLLGTKERTGSTPVSGSTPRLVRDGDREHGPKVGSGSSKPWGAGSSPAARSTCVHGSAARGSSVRVKPGM